MVPPGRVQHPGWFDAASPHFLEVLISADRGFFSWTPAMALGSLGLLLALRRFRLLATTGLVILAVTTYLNGARTINWSGDAFGGRRFEIVVPFLAIGLGVLLQACVRRPLLAPGVLLIALGLWNVGLVGLYRNGLFQNGAPLEQLAPRQVRQARLLADRTAGGLAGQRGRAFVYDVFVGEYFYWNANKSGTIDVADPADRYLVGGWSQPRNSSGPPTFRWALYPRSCVRFALPSATGDALRAEITARAPARLPHQTLAIELNRLALKRSPLGPEWERIQVVLPGSKLVRGQNLLCLVFSEALPPDQDGLRTAASVARIQLP